MIKLRSVWVVTMISKSDRSARRLQARYSSGFIEGRNYRKRFDLLA